MKARRRADLLGVALQLGAAGELRVFELLDRGEMAVDEDRVGQRPQMFGGLQFRGIRRQEEQVDVVRYPPVDAGGFPAGAVQHQHNLLGGTGSHLAGERGALNFKHRNADGGWQIGQMEDGPTRGRMDKADQIAPGEAVLDAGHGSLAPWGPDAAQQRFQADAVLIGRPQFDLRVREGGRDGPYARADLFLKFACCSASVSACRGRGTCRLCLARTR